MKWPFNAGIGERSRNLPRDGETRGKDRSDELYVFDESWVLVGVGSTLYTLGTKELNIDYASLRFARCNGL